MAHLLPSLLLIVVAVRFGKTEVLPSTPVTPDTSTATSGNHIPVLLNINNELFGQSAFPGEERRFALGNLDPSTQYEVRISYLSTNPATFFLTLEAPESDNPNASPRFRRALNTERMVVETDEKGDVLVEGQGVNPKEVVVVVKVLRAGRVAPGYESAASKAILFNIALEPLVLGVLPRSAQWMVLWGVVCIMFAAFVMVPWFYEVVRGEEERKES